METVKTSPLVLPKPSTPSFNSEGQLQSKCRDTRLGVLCESCDHTSLVSPPEDGIIPVICRCNLLLHFTDANVAGECPNTKCMRKFIVQAPPANMRYAMCSHCDYVLTCPSNDIDGLGKCPSCGGLFLSSEAQRTAVINSNIRMALLFLTIGIALSAIFYNLWNSYFAILFIVFSFPAIFHYRLYKSNSKVKLLKYVEASKYPCVIEK